MARQFDVVANPDAVEASARPYLVVLQSDLAASLNSAVVAPLVPLAAMRGATRLNPVLSVTGQEFWLATHELFAIDRRALRQPVANLAESRYAIIAALDLLFTGI
jgi:toxin CcdB